MDETRRSRGGPGGDAALTHAGSRHPRGWDGGGNAAASLRVGGDRRLECAAGILRARVRVGFGTCNVPETTRVALVIDG
jgi:hypothetical protein